MNKYIFIGGTQGENYSYIGAVVNGSEPLHRERSGSEQSKDYRYLIERAPHQNRAYPPGASDGLA